MAKTLSEYRSSYGANLGTLYYVMNVCYGPRALFAARPEAQRVAEMEILSVCKDYGRRGIGGTLFKLGLEVIYDVYDTRFV